MCPDGSAGLWYVRSYELYGGRCFELRRIGWLGGFDGVKCVCKVKGTVDIFADLYRGPRRYVSLVNEVPV